jgi:galactose-1-phosphate uridylyltransferase
MQRAGVRQTVDFVGFPDIQAQILDWPLTSSVLTLTTRHVLWILLTDTHMLAHLQL